MQCVCVGGGGLYVHGLIIYYTAFIILHNILLKRLKYITTNNVIMIVHGWKNGQN